MAAFLIIPLLISGFIVLTQHPYHFYRLHRYDGQLLYMKAAVYGFFCVSIVVGLAILLKACTSNFHPIAGLSNWTDFTKDESQNRLYSWMIAISISSVLIGTIWGWGAKVWYLIRFMKAYASGTHKCKQEDIFNHLKLSTLAPLLSELPIDKMFFESILHRKSILISMKCGKVYVGVISRISEPNETDAPNQEISLTPVMSGYRDKDTRRIHFINDYKMPSNVDTTINIPRSEVSHTSWFSMETHKTVVSNAFVGPIQEQPQPK